MALDKLDCKLFLFAMFQASVAGVTMTTSVSSLAKWKQTMSVCAVNVVDLLNEDAPEFASLVTSGLATADEGTAVAAKPMFSAVLESTKREDGGAHVHTDIDVTALHVQWNPDTIVHMQWFVAGIGSSNNSNNSSNAPATTAVSEETADTSSPKLSTSLRASFEYVVPAYVCVPKRAAHTPSLHPPPPPLQVAVSDAEQGSPATTLDSCPGAGYSDHNVPRWRV